MLAWVNPAMNARVALRYSLVMFPICAGLWAIGVTDRGFLLTSGVLNAWVVREAWRFWKLGGGGGSARRLFWAGVWQLPVVMVLAMVHKRGLWEGWGRWVWGEEEEEEAGKDGWLVEGERDGRREGKGEKDDRREEGAVRPAVSPRRTSAGEATVR